MTSQKLSGRLVVGTEVVPNRRAREVLVAVGLWSE